jgi:predicted transcriptional regulator
MTLREIQKLLEARPVAGVRFLDEIQVETAGAADLMSDVLAYSHSGTLLLTGLASAQSLSTADIADIRAIVYVRGKQPDPEIVAKAEERGMPLLCTSLGMFECCGRLYKAGIKDDGYVSSQRQR